MAILATAHRGQVAPESPTQVDEALGERTHCPFAVGPLKGKLISLVMGRVRSGLGAEDISVGGGGRRPSDPDQGGIGNFMARGAQERIPVEGGLLPWVPIE